MTIKSLLAAAVLTVCASANLWADVTGNILGSVRDSSNAIVVGAQVVATNVDTNFTKQVVSNTDGEYRLLALPPGHYNITATAQGFQQFVESGIEVKVNDRLHLDVTLQV
ncbi:MAG TPA: carboxypeptidase-like regulatory domain-containing protein, partial [Bryobacteraceae bacterium]|nr:carboxypeptidase-like regulatory domain-containing protein [Bryobacteraceae bacterium]